MIVGIIVSVIAALFAGIGAWWAWQRDQERIVVQKLLYRWDTATGDKVLEKDQFGPTFGILIRNRSLFPVHVSSVGFAIDGEVIQLERPLFQSKVKKNLDPNSNYPYVADDSDPRELPSQKFTEVLVNSADRPRIGATLVAAAKKHGITVEDLVISPKVVALVVSEAGNEFTSMPFLKRLKCPLEKALLAPK